MNYPKRPLPHQEQRKASHSRRADVVTAAGAEGKSRLRGAASRGEATRAWAPGREAWGSAPFALVNARSLEELVQACSSLGSLGSGLGSGLGSVFSVHSRPKVATKRAAGSSLPRSCCGRCRDRHCTGKHHPCRHPGGVRCWLCRSPGVVVPPRSRPWNPGSLRRSAPGRTSPGGVSNWGSRSGLCPDSCSRKKVLWHLLSGKRRRRGRHGRRRRRQVLGPGASGVAAAAAACA